MAAIDPGAERIARSFESALNSAIPALVDRVHVTGSAITDDWHEGRSDVDLVLRLTRAATARELAALGPLHRHFDRLDAIYLTTDQLRAGPDTVKQAPQAIAGSFSATKAGAQLTWVTWLEVEAGATLDGGPVERFADNVAERASEASRRNMREYWLPLAKMAAIKFAAVGPSATDMMWMTLGPPRLVATIEQGRILSKSEAGEFAAREWTAFAELIGRVLHARATGQGRFSRSDARQTLQLLRECADRTSRYT